MKPKVYIETSVISYLTARASRDVVVAGRQAITQEWWDKHRERFDVFVSELVEEEIAQGDPVAAALRAEKVAEVNLEEPIMIDDPIVEEIRRYRKEHAAKYGNDIHRICEALREAEQRHPERLVNFGPKRLTDRKPLRVAEETEEYEPGPEA